MAMRWLMGCAMLVDGRPTPVSATDEPYVIKCGD